MMTRNRFTRRLATVAFAAALACATQITQADAPKPAKPATQPAKPATQPAFEKDILAYEAADQKAAPEPGGVVFYGSSSIRMWKSLKEDFPGTNAINRGFGGSTAPDALRYLNRIVIPYKPSAVVVYEGDNDLAKGRTPEQYFQDCKTLAERVHKALPKTRILFLAIKPSLKRLELLPQQSKANKLVSDWVNSSNDSRLAYIDIVTPMMDENGKPRPELFLADGLHMTPAGYKVWVEAVKPHLAKSAEKSKKQVP